MLEDVPRRVFEALIDAHRRYFRKRGNGRKVIVGGKLRNGFGRRVLDIGRCGPKGQEGKRDETSEFHGDFQSGIKHYC